MQRIRGGRTVLLTCLAGAAMIGGCQREQQLPKSVPVEQHNARPTATLLAQLPEAVLDKVKHELAADPLLHGAHIFVDSDAGRVRLRGFVNSGAQEARALRIARTVSGDEQIEARLIRRGRSGVADGPLPAQSFLL